MVYYFFGKNLENLLNNKYKLNLNILFKNHQDPESLYVQLTVLYFYYQNIPTNL